MDTSERGARAIDTRVFVERVMSRDLMARTARDAPSLSAASSANGTASRSIPFTNVTATVLPSASMPMATHGTASFTLVRTTGGSAGANDLRHGGR